MQTESQQPSVQNSALAIRVAVLEERVEGMVKAGDGRETRLRMLEDKYIDLSSAIAEFKTQFEVELSSLRQSVQRDMANLSKSSFKQTVAIIIAIMLTAIGMAAYSQQMLLQHVIK